MASRRVFILGGHITPFIGKGHPDFIHAKHALAGTKSNPSLEDYLTTAVRGALDATGTPAKSIQRAWVGNFAGELFSRQGHLGSALVGAHRDLRFLPRYAAAAPRSESAAIPSRDATARTPPRTRPAGKTLRRTPC